MRERVDAERVRLLLRELGSVAEHDGACYLTGGATAVLVGWRRTTLDVDLLFVPEQDALLRQLPRLKNELRTNVELASPGDFIPLPSGWEERSLDAGHEGRLRCFHFDPYSQALAKLERGLDHDLVDVDALIGRGLVDRARLPAMFEEIAPQLYRFPGIDPGSFRAAVERAARR
jgi:hypothetical protein